VRSEQEAAAFLDPVEGGDLADPRTMRGVPEATSRLLRALAHGEPIAVYGDYDVDGLAGAALLADALAGLGGRVITHIPHRSQDGYGVHEDAVRSLAAAGARVMVTVDCGISAHQEVQRATELGVDAIVTDHHSIPALLPAAVAVLNPHQAECQYPFKDLAGGGVAFQLARSLLLASLPPEEAVKRWRRLAAFAALSTMADVVPLVGENRTIVAQGIEAVRAGAVTGLEAICRAARKPMDQLTGRDLSFHIIPRLNAAGRMGDPRDALDVLLAQDVDSARLTAARLEQLNTARRTRMNEILVEVERDLEGCEDAIVLAGAYPIGLAGLIAGRVADRMALPCVVIEEGDDVCRASVRGADGVHLIRVLEQCADALIQFGGHERAAGFSIYARDIERFRAAFGAAVRASRGNALPARVFEADGVLMLSSVGDRLVELVHRFEPVGAGNANPTFVARSVLVREARLISGGHFQMTLAQGWAVRRAVAFRPEFSLPAPGSKIDILFEVERSSWQGVSRVDIIVRDARPSLNGPSASTAPPAPRPAATN
jgi:single-stranded-DNA-specific exonuclease